MNQLGKAILFFLFILLISQGNLAFEATNQALTFWFECLVPSMFVGMVLIQCCLDYGVFNRIPLLSSLLNYLFFADDQGSALILSSIFLGAPAGAVLINENVKEGKLSYKCAQRLISCVSLATPTFILITCGSVLLHDLKLGIFLWLIEISICSLFLIVYRTDKITLTTDLVKPNFFITLKKAIKNSGIALFYIGGYLMIFLSFFNILTYKLPLEAKEILKSIAEFSLGCKSITSQSFSKMLQTSLIGAVLGFNGLCVHLQIFSLCEESKLSYPLFLFFRIIQACLSFSMGIILFSLLQ